MAEVLVLAEHRDGKLKDVTLEMLSAGKKIAEEMGGELAAVLLGYDVGSLAKKLASHTKRVLVVEDERLKIFNSETYQKVLSSLITQRKPLLTLIGHTALGMDLAPTLATELRLPLVTDCVDLEFRGGRVIATRQMYNGKVNAEFSFKESEYRMVTIRPGEFHVDEEEHANGEIIKVSSTLTDEDLSRKRTIKVVEEVKGEVDITKADILVAVGRGLKNRENLPLIEEFAKAIGGVLACSRPIADKGWMPKECHVGFSGKTVHPKLYLALGISGAFQHVLGMKGSRFIVAINKDPKAPILRVADCGIVDDMFKVLPFLKDHIAELKSKTERQK